MRIVLEIAIPTPTRRLPMFGASLLAIGLAFGAGLLVGWNVLPQPGLVKRLYERVVDWFNG
jgi:hypothetical protein